MGRIAAERTASTILSIVSFSLQEGITIEIFTFSQAVRNVAVAIDLIR
jgi:hypothetical protein